MGVAAEGIEQNVYITRTEERLLFDLICDRLIILLQLSRDRYGCLTARQLRQDTPANTKKQNILFTSVT